MQQGHAAWVYGMDMQCGLVFEGKGSLKRFFIFAQRIFKNTY
jgi:hypothetical protein